MSTLLLICWSRTGEKPMQPLGQCIQRRGAPALATGPGPQDRLKASAKSLYSATLRPASGTHARLPRCPQWLQTPTLLTTRSSPAVALFWCVLPTRPAPLVPGAFAESARLDTAKACCSFHTGTGGSGKDQRRSFMDCANGVGQPKSSAGTLKYIPKDKIAFLTSLMINDDVLRPKSLT